MGRNQRIPGPGKIDISELVPFGYDDNGVGALNSVIFIRGKIQGIFYLTTLIITSLRPFRVWQVPQEYENIQIFHESGRPRLLVQCIAVNIRVWLAHFFPTQTGVTFVKHVYCTSEFCWVVQDKRTDLQ